VPTQLTWVDRGGRRLDVVGSPGRYRNPELSPDGGSVVMEGIDTQGGSSDIFRFELRRGGLTRLTSDPANDTFPVWSPDAAWIMFGSDRGGAGPQLYRIRADGSGETRVFESSTGMIPSAWVSDDTVVYQNRPGFNLGLLSLSSGG